jgi:hypothetical protein
LRGRDCWRQDGRKRSAVFTLEPADVKSFTGNPRQGLAVERLCQSSNARNHGGQADDDQTRSERGGA